MTTALQSPQTGTYFAHVDGLRALAVLAVMIYHISPTLLPGGFVGVDIFFVISGYVVTASLAGHKGESVLAFLGQFYARRLARLTPALVVMLIVTTLFYILLVPKTWFNRAADSTGQAAFWGLSNWALDQQKVNYFEPRAELNPFTHTWSLGVEEQFYLIAPLLLFNLLNLHASRRRRGLAVAAMVVFSVLSVAACFYFGVHYGPRFVFYQITFRFWELAAGVLLYQLAWLIPASGGKNGRTGPAASWAGLALTVVIMVLPGSSAYPWLRSAGAVLATLLLIGNRHDATFHAVRHAFARPLAVWIGKRSYSLYLWHWPVYVFFRWTAGLNAFPNNVLALGLVTTLALLSYRWIENPLRYNARIKALPANWRIAGFALLLGAGWACGRLLLAAQPALGLGQPTKSPGDWYGDRQLVKSVYRPTRQCEPRVLSHELGNGQGSYTEYAPLDCPSKASARLFVLGDSHAVAYLPMFEQLSAEQGRTVVVFQNPGCSYIDLMEPINPARDPACFSMSRAAMQKVLALSRAGDIVFLPSLRLPRLIDKGGRRRTVEGGDTESGRRPYARTAPELQAIDAATRDAPQWFVPFQSAGLRVVFEAPKPVFRSHPFYCVDFFNRHNPDCADGLSELRVNQEAYRAPTVEALNALARRHPGLETWDPLPVLCDPRHCHALSGNRPLFFDGDHVSPYGNVVLYPSFRHMIVTMSSQMPQAGNP